MQSKLVKFEIRLFGVAVWSIAYLYNLANSRLVNLSCVPPALSYTSSFRELRTVLEQHIETAGVSETTASASWLVQCIQQSFRYKSPHEQRFLVTGNFYTSHTICRALMKLTNDVMRLLGTVRMANLSSRDQSNVKAAADLMSTFARGVCLHCEAFEGLSAHARTGTRHPSSSRTTATQLRDSFENVAPNAGYITLKYRNVAFIYCNNLNSTLQNAIEDPSG